MSDWLYGICAGMIGGVVGYYVGGYFGLRKLRRDSLDLKRDFESLRDEMLDTIKKDHD